MNRDSSKKIYKVSDLTPVMKQYIEIKSKYQDCILFFRMGDFYEMFYDDAEIASSILNIALTTRDKRSENPVPLCGVPYHSAETYIKKLLDEGFRVAICEQTEPQEKGRKIFKREVVRIYTPGVNFEAGEENFNYVASLCLYNGKFGFSYADVSTGKLVYDQCEDIKDLLNIIKQIIPKELVLLETSTNQRDIHFGERIKSSVPDLKILEEINFPGDENFCMELIKNYWEDEKGKNYRVESTFNELKQTPSALIALAGLLKYISRYTKIQGAFALPERHFKDSVIEMDFSTIRNLEIFETYSGDKKGSLYRILCLALTPGGKRELAYVLSHPLTDRTEILQRLSSVEEFLQEKGIRQRLREYLKSVSDIERITKRIFVHRSPLDVLKLKNFLGVIPFVKAELSRCSSPLIKKLGEKLDEFEEVHNLLESAIIDNPPSHTRDGGYIKRGFDREVDELYELKEKVTDWLIEYETKERIRTGIPSLKIGFNKVFGYYIEITKTHLSKVPENYERKQTLVNAERFVTTELKEWEEKILNREERLIEREKEVFNYLLNKIKEEEKKIIDCAKVISKIDVLLSFAENAEKYRYVKPEVVDDLITEIKGGRHPSLEVLQPSGSFIPLDIRVSVEDEQILMITGPNMAGKSTVLRTTALIQILAQCGSFVPAEYAKVGIADMIMSRVGASDDITRGKSTFMVEMEEMAEILRRATKRSLIVLDEIGRGTSTYDGISIAWAIGEYLHDRVGSRTLFATHYHELTEISRLKHRIANYTMEVKEFGDEIIFMYKIVKGSAMRSYGVEVARLAGLPQEVLKRAKDILDSIEKGKGIGKIIRDAKQLSLFQDSSNRITDELKKINLGEITPLEAINFLYNLKKMINE